MRKIIAECSFLPYSSTAIIVVIGIGIGIGISIDIDIISSILE